MSSISVVAPVGVLNSWCGGCPQLWSSISACSISLSVGVLDFCLSVGVLDFWAFATVPVFLLWVFVSWFIVLLGAQFTRCLEVVPLQGSDASPSVWRSAPCYRAWRILVHLQRAQRSGLAISQEALLAKEPGFEARELADSLKVLADAHWISRDDRFCWLLVRDLDELSLLDLARLVPPSLMVAEAAQNLPPEDARFRQLLEQHRHGVERDFNGSLASLMADVDA